MLWQMLLMVNLERQQIVRIEKHENHLCKFYDTKIIDDDTAIILGFDYEYIVRRDGIIISHARYNNKNMVMKQHLSHDGYKNIGLILNGKTTEHRVHRIVASAFVPNPENKPYINHKDGNRENNNYDNLEWCTQKENANHSINVLHKWSSSKNQKRAAQQIGIKRRKLSMEDAREIRRLYENGGISCIKLGKMFGLSKPCILRIIHYKSYKESQDMVNYGN